jgi:hypothetical protein
MISQSRGLAVRARLLVFSACGTTRRCCIADVMARE